MHTDNKNKIIKRNLRLSEKICVLKKLIAQSGEARRLKTLIGHR
jgi:hypothetical protein